MIDPSIVVDFALGACAVAIVPIVATRTGKTHGRMANAVAAIHPIASLCLFYSLAIHMHRRLGGWPRVIGDEGFPNGLVMHADLALHAFGSLLLGGIFAWPIAVLLCVCVPTLRPALRYLGIYALAFGATLGGMLLAPQPFLDWWWD